jgi:hypothetical protein
MDVPAIVFTVLTVIFAAGLVYAQIPASNDPASQISLANLNQRAAMLRETSDPVRRDSVCMPLSALGRQLDNALQPGVKVYLTGMLGTTNAPALGYYYFLRNYLFPRDVEISLGPVVFHDSGFEGVAADSPGILKSNGFDIVIGFPNNQIQVLPLTDKGVPNVPKSQ